MAKSKISGIELTERETKALSTIMHDTLNSVLNTADELNIDRDMFLRNFSDTLHSMCKVASFRGYEVNVDDR